MNCQKLEGVLTDLARDQIVDAGVRDEALQHCEVCRTCAQTLADQRALTFALNNLAMRWQSIDAPPALLQNLMVARRIQTTNTGTAGVSPAASASTTSAVEFTPGASRLSAFGAGETSAVPARPQNLTNYNRYWPAAIAAGLLLFFGIGAMVWRQEPASSNMAVVPAERPTPEGPVGSTQIAETEQVKESVAPKLQSSEERRRGWRTSGRRTTARPQKANPQPVGTYASTEIATEFLPLGYGSAISLQDGGQIVRVEVPRSTLVSFGLPVNMDRVGQRVKADLLLGIDGSARAIRFVQ